MSALPPPLNLDWDDLGDRTVVLLPDRLTEEPVYQAVREELVWLVEVLGRRRFLLDFARVPLLTSGPLGPLIAIRKRLQDVGGCLWLARVNDRCREVLDVTKLLPLFQFVEEGPVSTPPASEQDAAFRRAIVEVPDDVAPRLMYADWLQERGDPLGEFIRLQCLLSEMAANDDRRPALDVQAGALLQRYQYAWVGDVRRYVTGWEFHRGFPEVLAVEAARFLAHGSELISRVPLLHLKILDGARAIDALARCEHLGRLRDLQFNANRISDAGVESLARSPYLNNLRGLHLFRNHVGDRGARALGGTRTFTNLTTLDLGDNEIGDEGVAALARSPHLARLTTLKLNNNRVGGGGARALVESRYLERLTTLDLTQPPPGCTSPFAEERNTIPEPERRALRARFGDDACRF